MGAKRRVLAIGVDAAEGKLVRQLIDQGEMPFLRTLLADGRWIRLDSTADIGSSSVWPTFTTGHDPHVHGIYSEWCWEPESMSLSALTGRHLKPFWKRLSDSGRTVGVLGVPFMPVIGLAQGFEASERSPYISPNGHRKNRLVSEAEARRTLSHGLVKVSAPDDLKNLRRLAEDSVDGIKQRCELAERLLQQTQVDISIIALTETHEVSHCLWQTVEPEHQLFQENDLTALSGVRPTLRETFREVDRQIGRLVGAAGPEASVLVFSLHGMTAGRGAPTFLAPLMCEAGFSIQAEVNNQTWHDRAVHSLRNLKKSAPANLKGLYYRALPRETVRRLAAPTLLPQYDWSRTRAFPLVEEHVSSIRVNLKGREASGIVDLNQYDTICDELEQWLCSLKSVVGETLAKKVIRTAKHVEMAIKSRLPDIVVHWENAALASPLRIAGFSGRFVRDGERHLSQHTNEGFCILKSDYDGGVDDALPLTALSRLIVRLACS